MARKSGTLRRIASRTVSAGREHAEKLLKGKETVPEAAGAVVEDLLSGSKAKAEPEKAEKVLSKVKASTKKKPTTKTTSARERSQSK
jgi:hypothetical protein